MKIKELYLETVDLSATAAFYTEVLGLSVQQEKGHGISFLLGSTKITFTTSSRVNPIYHLAFDIPKNKLDEAYEWLKKRTDILPVTDQTDFSVFELWNAKSFYFYDNNKNLLELICRYDLSNESEQTFDSKSILSVSEIGMVTNDVPTLAAQLIHEYGLEVYAKQPAQENFTALGDEQGLFILVNENRNWFPTAKKADSFPTKVIFNTDKAEDQEFSIS